MVARLFYIKNHTMKQITLTLFTLLLCVSLSAAEYLKVGQTRTLSVGSISHLQGCQWTISRPSNVTFVQTPGTFNTSATIKATQGFSGDPCIVQCTYYYLEQDPVSGRYIYSRSGYKRWHIFVEGNSGEDNPVENPDTPGSKQIKLASNEVSVNAYGLVDIEVFSGYDRIIKWRIADKTIAKGTPLRNGWTLRVEGLSPGTTWAYASDAGGGQATCKITVKQRQYTEGETIWYPIDKTVPRLAVDVTDVAKKECCLTHIDDDYNANQTDGVLVVPEKVCGLTVVKIGTSTFSSKKQNIKKIILPNTIREIDDNAFSGCKLEEIELPIGLETIGKNAFSNTNLRSISISEGVKSIGAYCFWNCRSLTKAILPSTLREVSTFCFYDCRNLKDVTLTDGIEELAGYSFQLTGISQIVIPKSMQTIKNRAISSPCLISVICLGEKPCTLEAGAVRQNPVTLYVPQNSIEAYQTSDEWKDFTSIREIGNTEEALYICEPYIFNSSLDYVSAKISHKDGTEDTYYTDLLNYNHIPKAFSFAEYDGSDFHKYGTNSTEPIFTSTEIESGKAEKTFTLYPYGGNNIGDFTLPENWGKRDLLFIVDKSKSKVTFVYNGNMTGIKDSPAAANDKEITIRDLKGVVVYRGKDKENTSLPSGIYIVCDGKGNNNKVMIE